MILRLFAFAALLGGGCKKTDHCGPAATHHAELLAPLLQTWGVDAAATATFTGTFKTLHCAKTYQPATGLDCIRDAATLDAVEKCRRDLTEGAPDWWAATTSALGTVPVAHVAELDAFAARLVAAGEAAQLADPATPARCPPAIKKLHFVDFRLISAIARKKDPAVKREDLLGDRDLEDFAYFFMKKTRTAEDVWNLRDWLKSNQGKSLAVIHVAKLERPTVVGVDLADGEYIGGTLDAAISVIGDDAKVACRTPVTAASSASLGYAYNANGGDKYSSAERRVSADFEQKIPEALANATRTLLGASP